VLRARLLGALELQLDGTAIESPATQRPWGVFAYLALAGRPVSRAELANTFWPDVLDQSARASLRSALWALRRQIGDRLVVDGEHVGLDGVWVDVREFERLAPGDPDAAVELCRGELLEEVEDEWAIAARERHRARVIELFESQAQAAEAAGELHHAIELTRLQVDRDPFDEQAHRRLITRLDAVGDRAAAIRAYRAFAERLRRELGVAPSATTRELVEQLRAEAPADAPRTPPVPGLLPLVGRQRELNEVERAWRAAAGGSGSVALVCGEAGIGKTRLATELRLRAEASGARTATCAALDLGGTAPFSLWAELIRELLPALPAPPSDAAWPDDLAVLVSELPAHFGRSGVPSIAVAPDLQRTRLFEAVVALLGWAARKAPLLLVLEDAHDADAPSLELAGYSARRVASLPVLMLITRRELPDSADADRLEHALRSRGLLACELTLGPLPSEAVASLARSAGRLDATDAARVAERAEGNALLAVETARVIASGRVKVAPSLRGSVRATLGPLSGDVRRLVEIAAVAARPLEPAEVDQLSLHEAAADALQTGLLETNAGRLAFRHALLREAAHEEIAEPRRRTLHRQWAGVTGRPDEAARHLRLAGADLESVRYLVRAAADARTVAALDEAAAYLEEALAIAPDRAEEWLELGELEAWRGRREPSDTAFRRGLELLDESDPLTLARAHLRQARAYHGPICVPRAVLDNATKALELLDRTGGSAEEERSEALAARAWAEAVAGSIEEAERLLAELSSRALGSDDLRTYNVGHARALALMRRGRFTASYGPFIAAGEAIGRVGRPDLTYDCWVNAAGAATAAGEPERALEFLDRGMAAVAGQALQSIEVHLLAARSFVLRGVGRLEEAREAAESEQTLAEQLAQPELEAMASHDRGLVALQEGMYESAVELLAAALVDGARISRPLTRLALAEALARGGQPEPAAEQVRATVLEPLRPSDFPDSLVPRLARVQGLIALVRDEREEAARRLEEAARGWERLLERTNRAESITTVLADLGRPVVGLVEPERELAQARADLKAIEKETRDAVVP
jgi:DNA-binding SARP family transcriptional activator/tetratricopeptide (TPR) repeat protein